MSWLLALACTGNVVDPGQDSEAQADLTEQLYDPDRLLVVALELPEDDWDALRHQTRSFTETLGVEDCQSDNFDNPFTWFEASVTLDGEHFERVDLRKKGFLGSLSEDKPSLKLDLGEYVDGQQHLGARRITLNNSISDPSYLRQCLAYAWFADAGHPAPRCNLARVSVNGRDLGLYVNLEPIKKPFLERHFEHGEANLYEGTLSDFREGWTGTIEKKNNESEDDWSDIQALVEAAAAPDDQLIEALDGPLDLDRFLGFWAAEVLIEHGDGYAANTNNYYLYADPADGGFDFIPWGTDGVLYGGEVGAVYATAWIPNRLMQLDEGRALYEQALLRSLEAWDEGAHSERIDGFTVLIDQELEGEDKDEVILAGLDVARSLEERREEVEADLDDGLSWPWEPRDDFCLVPEGALSAQFSTTWGSLYAPNIWTTGESTMSLQLTDEDQPWSVEGSAVAGESEGSGVLYLLSWISDHEAILIYAVAETEAFEAPGTLELDLGERLGALFYLDTETMEDFTFVAYIVGELELEQSSTEDDEPVVGAFEGQFLTW